MRLRGNLGSRPTELLLRTTRKHKLRPVKISDLVTSAEFVFTLGGFTSFSTD